jgi:Tfp pilus assembly protein PilN
MIRINLLPAKRKASARARAPAGGAGQWWLLGMLLVWSTLGGLGAWLLIVQEDETAALRRQVGAKNKEAEEIRQEIQEDELAEKQAELARIESAIETLKAKQRTPVFVMYELAMVLSDVDKGGGPDIDVAKYRQNVAADPASRLNERWDSSGVWLSSIKDEGGRLKLDGIARDAADLSEFTRRLRASARFGELTHPNYKRDDRPDARTGSRHLTWTLNVQVKRWN